MGGTIVMVPDSKTGALKPTKDIKEIIALLPSLVDKAEITFQELENLDSANINPNHWTKLARKIAEIHSDYDGIIVTHGTDTMAYTASALSLALGRGLKIPIVFTGSQLPLIAFGTDARFNLENSVKTIIKANNEDIAEVMIVFGDKVFRGNRTIKTNESKFSAFDSPTLPPLAEITAIGISFISQALKVQKEIPFELKPSFSSDILCVELIPGSNPFIYREILKSGRCRGLLLQSFGAGNVPSIDEYSFLPLIREATEIFQIPVLVATQFIGGVTHMNMYETGKLALDDGAIPTGDLTDVMAQVKFMWAVGQGHQTIKDVRKIIQTNLVGESSL